MSEVEFIPPVPPNTFQALATAAAQPIGSAVCSAASATPLETKPAKADAFATSLVVGLATRVTAAAGDQQYPRYIGELTLTTAEWTAITEEAGVLVEGDAYYLSAANAGKITHTAPVAAGSFVAQVGIALSPHTLLVQISAPVGPHA
jgi:hypothetical protein